MILRSGIYLYT